MVSTYTRRNAILLLLAKRQVEVGVLTRMLDYNEDQHPRDDKGQWVSGNVLYHGTSSLAAEKIKTEGLKPGGSLGVGMFGGHTNKEHVNLTTDKTLAKVAAALAAEANPGSTGVVIEVRLPKSFSKITKINPNNKTTYLHSGTIHPSHLTFKEPKTLAEWNEDLHPRDDHGRFGPGGGGPSGEDFVMSPSEALGEIANGYHATVSANDVRDVLDKAADTAGPIDLTNLTIDGTPIFAGGLNRMRDTMPQIPKEHQKAFLKDLSDKGIDVREDTVRPSKLLPTQNEIDAVRVGQKLREYDSGNKDLRAVMVSKDNYVLDGHHRWAVMATLDVESPKLDIKMPVIRIMQDHAKALNSMLRYTRAHGISNRALATRETAVHQAADAHLNPMTVAVMYAFLKARKVLKADPKNVTGAMKTLRTSLGEALPAALLACLVAGGEATVLPQTRAAELRVAAGPIKLRFDRKNPAAAKWAREHAAELIDGITTTTEESIREAIARGQEGEVDVYDEVLAAVGDEARAGVIARTESMRAANEGQRQMWGQAVDDGLLTGDEQREWIAAEAACPECDVLDGELADLDGEYPGDGGDGPPLHPNCRCTEGISAMRSAAYNKNELRDKYGHWSKGGGVSAATPGGSISGSESPAVMAAVEMLPEDAQSILSNIVVAYAVDEKVARSTKGGGSITEGWVDNNDPTKLYIASWSDAYRGAMKGDRESTVRLAGFIAHEQYHMVNGPHEAGAYDRQIEVLTKLGASKDVIKNVQKAKDYVTSKEHQ